jgi:hypothetical protein
VTGPRVNYLGDALKNEGKLEMTPRCDSTTDEVRGDEHVYVYYFTNCVAWMKSLKVELFITDYADKNDLFSSFAHPFRLRSKEEGVTHRKLL